MTDDDNCDARIALSVRRLREWQWMWQLSTEPENVVAQLRKEARELIGLGTANPGKAKSIGKIVVAYHRLITLIKDGTSSQRSEDA